jgi:hypothetical protein
MSAVDGAALGCASAKGANGEKGEKDATPVAARAKPAWRRWIFTLWLSSVVWRVARRKKAPQADAAGLLALQVQNL